MERRRAGLRVGLYGYSIVRRSPLYILIALVICTVAYASRSADVKSRMASRHASDPAVSATDTTIADVPEPDALVLPDSAAMIPADSIVAPMTPPADSLMLGERATVSRIVRSKTDIEDIVTFNATDSLIMTGNNFAFMYGNSTVEYTDIKLNSGEIRMDLDSTTVYAVGVTDSVTGKTTGDPIFSDKSGDYESKTMKYNFKTQRGFIQDVVTEQGEGFLMGRTTKKMEDGSFYIENGRYTTCDDHDHPHFYLQLTKARVVPKKNIVTGPAYMVLADVPLPLAVPFGYFPFSKEYSSGIIFPTFGEDYNRGFYARDGGYYFAINDNVDLALRGEIYTRGSWGISARSAYVKRYKFRGSIDISYINTVYGDKGSPDYQKMNNFRVTWNHSMDPKANPNLNFSAAVDFATSGYSRNDLNSYYNSAFTDNTKSSTVNLTYRVPGSKWSFSANANIAQRTQDSTLAVSFPNLTVTMSQTAPFKRKKAMGGERWYEKIRLSYSGQFQNSLTARQDQFFHKSLIRDWRNGIRHSLPISATFSLFKYINISPSISINDRMYFNKLVRDWDPNASREVVDTLYGFYNIFDFNASISMDTKIYGFWKPMKFLGDKVQMIRHVLTPTISLSGAPDFGDAFWGVYGTYTRPDANGVPQTITYNHFQNGCFGSPSRGKNGVVSVNLANNLEMKVKSDADSTGVKKISLIENLTLSQSYNFAADSLNFSNLNASILLRLFKNFNLSLSSTWDPYMYELSPSGNPVRVNKLRIGHGRGFAKLSSTGTSFSYTFNNDTFKRKNKDENDKKGSRDLTDPEDSEDESFAEKAARRRAEKETGQEGDADVDGYEKWSFPWSLTINYSISYGYGAFDYDRMDYVGKWTQNLSFSGSVRPTKNWNFSFSASYNFDLKKLAYMNCSISRDLHCFTMSCSFVPVGPYKSFNFHIGVKASMLSDLKYDRRSSSRDIINWY